MNLLTRFGLARSRFTIAAMISLLLAGIGLYPRFPEARRPRHRHPHGGGVGAVSGNGAGEDGKPCRHPIEREDPGSLPGVKGHQGARRRGFADDLRNNT